MEDMKDMKVSTEVTSTEAFTKASTIAFIRVTSINAFMKSFMKVMKAFAGVMEAFTEVTFTAAIIETLMEEAFIEVMEAIADVMEVFTVIASTDAFMKAFMVVLKTCF